jgi:hypothetical protein
MPAHRISCPLVPLWAFCKGQGHLQRTHGETSWHYHCAIQESEEKVTSEEQQLFVQLLISHRHLWMAFEELRHLQEHPEMDWETVHRRFAEESEEIYQSLTEALLEGKPVQDKLRTILLFAAQPEFSVRDWKKRQH